VATSSDQLTCLRISSTANVSTRCPNSVSTAGSRLLIFAALSPSSQPASPESMTCTLGYAAIRLPRVVPHAGSRWIMKAASSRVA
jgi:hypothetical protein